MRDLDNEIRRIVENCTEFITQMSDRLRPKYHSSLGKGGSGNVVRDAAKKLQFHIFDRDSLKVIQDQFAVYTRKITVLMVTAVRYFVSWPTCRTSLADYLIAERRPELTVSPCCPVFSRLRT